MNGVVPGRDEVAEAALSGCKHHGLTNAIPVIKPAALLQCLVIAALPAMGAPISSTGQDPQPAADAQDALVDVSESGVVSYPAEFFRVYQARTALDMVNRVPGFTLDDGGDQRGFGAAAGNVLINDRRPTAKQDAPSAILGRIPADQVERIDLIRSRVRNIDLQSHSEVVSVILRDDAPAAIRWEIYLRYNFDHGTKPFAGLSLTDHWKDVDYNMGFDTSYSRSGDPGVIRTFDGDGELTEIRTDSSGAAGPDFNAYLNASTWLGQNFLKFNTRVNSESRNDLLESLREPQLADGELRSEIIETLRRNKRLEVGIDGERVLSDELTGRAIMLYSLLDQSPSSSQRSLDAAGQQTRFQLEDEEATATELIGRMELDWAGFSGHAIELNLERALNVLDNEQVFTDDTGAGPVVIDIPNANVRVEEVRWNFVVEDTWRLDRLTLNGGLGFEHSTIAQTGDTNLERTFDFLKPRAYVTWAGDGGRQTRLGIEREVSQLDFEDFVSAAVFEDDDRVPGNPQLQPESTWIAELSHERRFGDVGLGRVTAFYHWISDVIDLLPLGATLEAPGNIGDGRRWGLILETTLPVLANAQISAKARWQNSTVVDPVTGEDRSLSAEGGYRADITFLDDNRYAFDVDFRQDLESEKLSWGVGLAWRDRRVLYKANELDIFDEGYELTAFVETTRWFGMKLALEGENLLNAPVTRDRTIYVGERSLTPVLRHELRDGTNGTRIFLRMSGTF